MFWHSLLETFSKKNRQSKNLTINQESSIFELSSWNLVKIISSRGVFFDLVSWSQLKNCRFFISSQILIESGFFFNQSLEKLQLFIPIHLGRQCKQIICWFKYIQLKKVSNGKISDQHLLPFSLLEKWRQCWCLFKKLVRNLQMQWMNMLTKMKLLS